MNTTIVLIETQYLGFAFSKIQVIIKQLKFYVCIF